MKTFSAYALVAVSLALSAPVLAQMDHGSMHGGGKSAGAAPMASAQGADAALVEGLVKKVDKTKGTVTLAHGAMNGMPPMTMVYRVKETSLLDKLAAGQKIRFATDPADGGMTVSRFELVK